MKWLLIILAFVSTAEAQIYRCETPAGTVFSDTRCSSQAELMTVEDLSSGIEGGPSEAVVAELDKKRAQREEDRQEARKLRATQASQQPLYVPAPVEQTVVYPGLWPWRPGPRPHPRPPHARPKPAQPSLPPDLPVSGGGTIQFPRR